MRGQVGMGGQAAGSSGWPTCTPWPSPMHRCSLSVSCCRCTRSGMATRVCRPPPKRGKRRAHQNVPLTLDGEKRAGERGTHEQALKQSQFPSSRGNRGDYRGVRNETQGQRQGQGQG